MQRRPVTKYYRLDSLSDKEERQKRGEGENGKLENTREWPDRQVESERLPNEKAKNGHRL